MGKPYSLFCILLTSEILRRPRRPLVRPDRPQHRGSVVLEHLEEGLPRPHNGPVYDVYGPVTAVLPLQGGRTGVGGSDAVVEEFETRIAAVEEVGGEMLPPRTTPAAPGTAAVVAVVIARSVPEGVCLIFIHKQRGL